jgi:GDP-L-fucose synthase
LDKNDKIYVAGHRGMVGSAIVRKLKAEGFHHIVTRNSSDLNLVNQADTLAFFQAERPDIVFLAAAKVGGIHANNVYRGQFIYENMMIQNNVIHSSYLNGVKKLLFLGSTCIYPKLADQPIKEEYLLTGTLEQTNEPYAIAKIAGIKMCESYNRQYGVDYISVMPTNLYGPNDNYDLENSHVLPALIRKFHEAKVQNHPTVTIWGSGTPMREFLHVDDLAGACFHLMQTYSGDQLVNIGTGVDVTIRELAETISDVVGFKGSLTWDSSKPDGTPRKLTDVSRLHGLGYHHQINLREGIEMVYADFVKRYAEIVASVEH